MKWLIAKFLSLVKNFKTGLGSWNFFPHLLFFLQISDKDKAFDGQMA